MTVQDQGIFTPEQMTGSGQISITDQIHEYDQRRELLRVTPHIFHEDPGHAWLEVDFNDLKVLGIWGKISQYSYMEGDKVYLEEDQDAGIYLKTLFPEGWNSEEFNQFRGMIITQQIDEYSKIRNFTHYGNNS